MAGDARAMVQASVEATRYPSLHSTLARSCATALTEVLYLILGDAMKYETQADAMHHNEFVAEAIGDDCEVYVVRFSGPNAEMRANEYAAWKNADNESSAALQPPRRRD